MNFHLKRLHKKTNLGFTLIELLVVIAIIGLLSSMIFANLSDARVKSTNAQILAERHQVEIALQTYYNDNGYLPAPSTGSQTSVYSCVGANCIWPGKTLQNLALNTKPNNSHFSLQNLLAAFGVASNQLVGYIPKIYFTQSVFLNNVEYRGLVYACTAYDSAGKCTKAALYYPMFGVQPNYRCTDGINSIIAQSVSDPNAIAPDPSFTPACSGAPYLYNANSL